MFETLAKIANVKELRGKLVVTALLLLVYRLGCFIPTPGIDVTELTRFISDLNQGKGAISGFLSMADMFTGGAMRSGAIFSLGIMPYITASIIFQLLVAIVPSLSRLAHEGSTGRKKITQLTRLATVGLCLVQSGMICYGFVGQGREMKLISPTVSNFEFVILGVLSLTVGTMFLMWLGEQIDEFGIGNGVSLIIMGGIIAGLPSALSELLGDVGKPGGIELGTLVLILILFVAMTLAVVMMTLGTRRVACQASKATRGRKVYGGQRQFLPLKVNQAGVIPIIFAQAILSLPAMIFSAMAGWLNFQALGLLFQPGAFWYTCLYVVLIMFFCYFYTAITFNPSEMADNLKQSGMYIPGIRPGKRTSEHLERIMTRIALAGSVFLSFIAILPQFIIMGLGINVGIATMLGGTSLLIVVGVALDVVQRVESYLLMKNYEGFGVAGGRVRGRKR